MVCMGSQVVLTDNEDAVLLNLRACMLANASVPSHMTAAAEATSRPSAESTAFEMDQLSASLGQDNAGNHPQHLPSWSQVCPHIFTSHFMESIPIMERPSPVRPSWGRPANLQDQAVMHCWTACDCKSPLIIEDPALCDMYRISAYLWPRLKVCC